MGKKLSTYRRIVLLILIFLATPSIGLPEDVMVVTEIWPPFRISEAGTPDRLTGIDIDLLEKLAERLQLTYQVKRLPWARCLEFMRSGDGDLITGLAHTPERAEFILYSELPYHSVAPAFYVAKGDAARIKTYNDLYSVRIGYSLKSAYFEPFNSDSALKKVGVSTEHQLIRMLAGGRLDVIIGTDCNVEYDIARMGLKDTIEKTEYRPEKQIDLYVGISRKSPLANRLDAINQVIADLIRSGEMKRMTRKYF